jgi:YD repeat-containing protein
MSARDVSNDRDVSALARYLTMIRCGGPSASAAAVTLVATKAKQIFEVRRAKRVDLNMGILPGGFEHRGTMPGADCTERPSKAIYAGRINYSYVAKSTRAQEVRRHDKRKNNLGRTVGYAYNSAGNTRTGDDANGKVTSDTYDSSHRLLDRSAQ